MYILKPQNFVTTLQDKKYLSLALVLLPSIPFFGLLWHYSLNIPIIDDIEGYNGFLLRFLDANFIEKFKLLFANSSDHPIFLGRLIALIFYWGTGELNYRHLILFGNLNLIIFIFLSYKLLRKHQIHFLYLFPVSLFIFSIQNYRTNFWTITLYQNSVIFIIFYVCLLFLWKSVKQKNNYRYLIISAILASVITYNMSNGFIIWITGSFVLFLASFQKKRGAIIWCFIGAIVLYIFFSTRPYTPQATSIKDFRNITNSCMGGLSFLGAFFDIFPSYFPNVKLRLFLAVLMGSIALFCLGYTLFQQYKTVFLTRAYVHMEEYMFIISGCIIFILLTSVIISIFRCLENPYIVLNDNRHYRSYSSFFLCFVYLYCIITQPYKFRINTLLVITILALGGYSGSIYFLTPEIKNMYYRNLCNAQNQINNNMGLGDDIDSNYGKYVHKTMNRSVEKKIYTYPHNTDIEKIKNVFHITQDPLQKASVTIKKESGTYIITADSLQIKDGAFLCMKSKKEKWVFYERFNGQNYAFYIPSQYLKAAEYDIFLALLNGYQVKYYKSKTILKTTLPI